MWWYSYSWTYMYLYIRFNYYNFLTLELSWYCFRTMWIIPFCGHNRFNIYQIVQRMILYWYYKNFLVPYRYHISFFINMHAFILVWICFDYTKCHIVNYRKKLWSYINHSIMKWYIIVLFSCSVYHLFIPHSKHRSITSKNITQSRMGCTHPNFFQSKMWLSNGSRYLNIRGSPPYFTPFYKVIFFNVFLWLYWIHNGSLHDHENDLCVSINYSDWV